MCATTISYRPRVVDEALLAGLSAVGAVLIEGPRGCGKTTTAKHIASSTVTLESRAAQAAGRVDPDLLLDGERPRLIDEWQLLPDVWNHVRRAVDDSGGIAGSFILAASAALRDDATRHSGAGRILRLRMRPMTLAEMGHSNGSVSIRAMFDGSPIRARESRLNVRDLARLVCQGGWPGLVGRNTDEAQMELRNYLADVCQTDLRRADGVTRDHRRVQHVLASLAGRSASYSSARAIAAAVSAADGPIDAHTVLAYLAALEGVFVIENLSAWMPVLRSKSRQHAGAKRHFVDPSLAAAALALRPQRLLEDVDLLGRLVESMVVRDLRVYAAAIEANLFAYRDNTGLEADAIIETRDGHWGAFKVTLGAGDIEKAAQSLLTLAARVDASRHGRPLVLAVITGWGYGYTRPDGVSVIPIGTLAA